MTGNVHSHRQTRHMGGHLLNGKAKAGGLAAKALRTNAQCIDGGKQLLLQLRVVGVGVGDVQRAQQRLLDRKSVV